MIRVLLGYITILLVITTVWEIAQARTIQLAYIDNRNFPGGPWQWFLASQSDPVNVILYALLFLETFLCDLLVVSDTSKWTRIVLIDPVECI